jgi:Transposase IS66 family
VVYLQHQQHTSYERTSQCLTELLGVSLSEGGQACIMGRAGAAAEPLAQAIRSQARQQLIPPQKDSSVYRVGTVDSLFMRRYTFCGH